MVTGATLAVAIASLALGATSASMQHDAAKATAHRGRRQVRQTKRRKSIKAMRERRMARARLAQQGATAGVAGSIIAGQAQAIDTNLENAMRTTASDASTAVSAVNAQSQNATNQAAVSLVGDVINVAAAGVGTYDTHLTNVALRKEAAANIAAMPDPGG